MLKSLLIKQMMLRQLKDVPKAQQDKILSALESDPNFFASLASEIKEEIESGADQMSATIKVVTKHQDKLKKLTEGTN